MADMRNLYQEVILDHNRKPRNYGALADADRTAHGHNPLCGDHYTLYIKLSADGGTIERVGFDGEGCAISKAAASLMTTRIKGKPIDQALALVDQFRNLVTGKLDPETDPHDLGSLRAFAGVAALPVRIKCALLPWHALRAALDGDVEASTEGDSDPVHDT